MEQYIIAGHSIQISGKAFNLLSGFDCFIAEDTTETPLLTIHQDEKTEEPDMHPTFSTTMEEKTYDFFFSETRCIFRIQTAETPQSLWMEVWKEANRFQAKTNGNHQTDKDSLRFILWLAFGWAALHQEAVSIHASTIMYQGKSVLFLGESGTGKSTHTGLWLNHIPESELLNDDSPFIRVDETGRPRVYGSPWSGKTACYKKLKTPIAAFVRLSQAPRNHIRRLKGVEAIGALLPSCPYMFAYNQALSEYIYEILSFTIQQVPVYHLECRPDADAAYLVRAVLQKDGYL